MSDGKNPWDQQPSESIQHFERFQQWMSDGRPQVSKWAQTIDGNTKSIQAIASRNKWTDRAKSYLAHLDATKAEMVRDRIAAAADVEAELLLDALDWLKESLAHHRQGGEMVPIRNWDAFLKRVIELRRLTNDKATANFKLDLNGADEDQLEQLHTILSGIADENEPTRH